jgi:pantothenate kinase-related protein Tda10
VIVAPSTYAELLPRVAAALGPDRKPLLIGFDGRDGGGKTTSANCWLGNSEYLRFTSTSL